MWFRWASAEEYPSTAPGAGCLVLVRPALASRQRRWQQVLEWYACHPLASESTALPSAGLPEIPGRIIALDPGSEPAARVLASFTARKAELVNGARELASLLDESGDRFGHDPVVLIGLPKHLDAATIGRLNGREGLEWSVLTARDHAGLSFVVAKVIAHRFHRLRRPSRKIVVVDAMGGHIRPLDPSGARGPRRPLTASDVASVIDGDWEAVVLRAHGEGTHAQLGSAVLCGLADGDERLSDGRPADGCRREQGICKRVHAPDVRVHSFSDLRVAQLAFYSCNGFSVASELYPSESSAVLALADGYAVSVLSNDRPGNADQEILDLAALRVVYDGDLRQLWIAENSRYHLMEGTRPWIRFGDAATPSTAPHGESELVSLDGTDGTLAPGVILRVEPAEYVRRALLNERSAEILLERGAPARAREQIRLVNGESEWNERWERCLRFRRRSLGNAELPAEIRRIFADAVAKESAAAASLEAFTEVQRQVAAVCVEALDALEQARQRGVLTRRTTLLCELLDLLVRTWDATFSDLAETCLLEGSVERLFSRGRVVARRPGDVCARCRQSVEQLLWTDPSGLFPQWMQTNCPTCGPQAAWLADGPQLRFALPSRVAKGGKGKLEIMVDSGGTANDDECGILTLVFRDKGRGRVFFRHRQSDRPGDLGTLAVPFPSDLTSELHTLRGLWVSTMDFAYRRVRCAALPAEA